MKLPELAVLGSVLGSFAIGCGDSPTSTSRVGSPTAAPAISFPSGTTFTLVSGETGLPIEGARLVFGGEDIFANGAGEVTIPREARFFTPVDIVAAGYLDRSTTFKAGELRFTLWPKASANGLTEHSTAEIVYTVAGVGVEPVLGQEPLLRWQSTLSPIEVIFGDGFDGGHEHEIHTQIEAVAEFNRILPDGISYLPPRFGALPTRGYVELRIDPSYSSCVRYNVGAVAPRGGRGEYASARIIYCSQAAAGRRSIALHELGHTAGLQHSSSEADMMYRSARALGFHAREGLLMKLMYQRPGGNLFPDSDRGSNRQLIGSGIELLCGTRVESVPR